VHELGRAKEPGTGDKESDRKGRRREKDSAEGGGRYLWSSRKRRGLSARAFPDPGAAKPGGANTGTQIIKIKLFLVFKAFSYIILILKVKTIPLVVITLSKCCKRVINSNSLLLLYIC
jgi:hypothetical protein